MATPHFLRERQAWAETSGLEGGRVRVRIGGPFRGAWLAALCRQLAERRISIEQVHARATRQGDWIAELYLLSLPGGDNAKKLHYLSLIEEITPSSERTLELDSYNVLESSDHGGTLRLTLEAADSLGFLGSLLAALAGVNLYPIELHIETRKGRAQDCLWLATGDQARPSAEMQKALEAVLSAALEQSTRRSAG